MSDINELRKKGIIHIYNISKTDGTEIDDEAEFFVLRLDGYGGDLKHIAACRIAVLAYAEAIHDHLPKLAEDIWHRSATRTDPIKKDN